MIFFYSILQWLLLVFLAPLLPLFMLVPKYRQRIPARLGIGLGRRLAGLRSGPRLWIHALSVGEAASARPLLAALRARRPDLVIIMSATTTGGWKMICDFGDLVDCRVPFPFDLPLVVPRFLRLLRPDLFVLVETDFWPGLLAALTRRRIPAVLVNGRFSADSFARYQRLRWLFAPMFSSFTRVSMQMEKDAGRLAALGVAKEKIIACGNLKFDYSPARTGAPEITLPKGALVLVAGSTHDGEEEPLCRALAALVDQWPALYTIIAPRRPQRAGAVMSLAAAHGLRPALRSQGGDGRETVLVLDTLGELAGLYRLAALAFIGGSLIPEGGHNPLEAAAHGVPVLFGPHMEDFSEIAAALEAEGGARQTTAAGLERDLSLLLADAEARRRMGEHGLALVRRHQGAAGRCLSMIEEVLDHAPQS